LARLKSEGRPPGARRFAGGVLRANGGGERIKG